MGFKIMNEPGKYTKWYQLRHSPGEIRTVDVNKTNELQRGPELDLYTENHARRSCSRKSCLQK